MQLPILKELVSSGFSYGGSYLIEFQPDSLWYGTSLTIAAHASMEGIRTDYHTYQHDPREIRASLVILGVDVQNLERDGTLRVLDSYTLQTRLGSTEIPQKSQLAQDFYQSLSVSERSLGAAQEIRTAPEIERNRLHIDDNTSVLLQYNQEKAVVDFWRVRHTLRTRTLGLVFVSAILVGVHSEAFYKQFESLHDGIIDFKSEEVGGQIEQLLRVRMMQGKQYNSKWRQLRVLNNGEVKLAN